MKTNTQNNKGFTLIELIMVTIILGILAAVAIPRYMATVTQAEEAAEDAVITSIKAGLETYATEQLLDNGRRGWPTNPFDALETKPAGYQITTTDGVVSATDELAYDDGDWTFYESHTATGGEGSITHRRNDNTVYFWDYQNGNQISGEETVGSIASRVEWQ